MKNASPGAGLTDRAVKALALGAGIAVTPGSSTLCLDFEQCSALTDAAVEALANSPAVANVPAGGRGFQGYRGAGGNRSQSAYQVLR